MALERSGDVEFGDYLVEDENLNASSLDQSNNNEDTAVEDVLILYLKVRANGKIQANDMKLVGKSNVHYSRQDVIMKLRPVKCSECVLWIVQFIWPFATEQC